MNIKIQYSLHIIWLCSISRRYGRALILIFVSLTLIHCKFCCTGSSWSYANSSYTRAPSVLASQYCTNTTLAQDTDSNRFVTKSTKIENILNANREAPSKKIVPEHVDFVSVFAHSSYSPSPWWHSCRYTRTLCRRTQMFADTV